MNEIIDECRKLNQMIVNSKEYKNYIFAKNSIKAHEDLYGALKEFKQRYSDIMRFTEGNPYDEILRLYYDNDELIHNSTVNEYLCAESAFSRLIKDVIGEISGGFKMDI